MPEPKALVGNAADPEQVKWAGEREQSNRQREINDVAYVLSTRQGRRFIWRLLCDAGIYRSSFHTNGSMVYFNEGRRDVGLKLLAEVSEADPMAPHMMAMEAKQDDGKREPTPKTKEMQS